MADAAAKIGLCGKTYALRRTDLAPSLVLDVTGTMVLPMPDQFEQVEQRFVLILENDPLIGDGMALMVSDAGYEVAIFKSLSEARAGEPRNGTLCAIISDYDLDGEPNGVEAARALRADRQPALPVLPVLIVTAARNSDVEASARAAGFEVSAKPASAAFLRRWLAQNAHRSRSRAPWR